MYINQGYNGSQLWDVAFAVQAILATKLVDEYSSMLKKAHNFIKNTQVRQYCSSFRLYIYIYIYWLYVLIYYWVVD